MSPTVSDFRNFNYKIWRWLCIFTGGFWAPCRISSAMDRTLHHSTHDAGEYQFSRLISCSQINFDRSSIQFRWPSVRKYLLRWSIEMNFYYLFIVSIIFLSPSPFPVVCIQQLVNEITKSICNIVNCSRVLRNFHSVFINNVLLVASELGRFFTISINRCHFSDRMFDTGRSNL